MNVAETLADHMPPHQRTLALAWLNTNPELQAQMFADLIEAAALWAKSHGTRPTVPGSLSARVLGASAAVGG